MRLGVRLLGPLEVECNGRPVSIGAAKERLIVVLLALHVGEVVSIERLVDGLWGEDPPESAAVSVRVLVSRLRKTIAAAGCRDVIATRPPGYVLRAGEVDVDVQRFEALATEGRARLSAGEAGEAAATLRAALRVWRGERPAESERSGLRAEAARLAETRRATLDARIDADLAAGRHAELVGELEELCQTDPLRERLWAQRMLALYRCGRQADALAAYQRLRATLSEELGLAPSGELRRLETAILAQDPALASPSAAQPAARPPAMFEGADVLVPLPPALAVSETVACIGRDAPLGELRQVWNRVLSGQPRVVLVRGEAGVGKTRLVREFAREVHARGPATVLYGRCDEDVAVPYRPIRECLTHYLASVPEGRLAGHDPQRLGEISRVVPDVARRSPEPSGPDLTDPDAQRYLLFSAIAGLLDEVASAVPVVLVLDDLHWADRPTLQLLRHLAGVLPGRVLVVGTYRDAEASAAQPFNEAMAALCREPTVGHLRLEALSEPAVASIMEAMAGGALDAAGRALARDLARDTDCNAFLVVEQARHLWQTGTLVQLSDGRVTAATDLASAGLPHTVQQVVAGRLGQLDDTAVTVLSVASVIGEQFDLDLLHAATGCDEDQVLDALEAAGRRALVAEAAGESGSFRFAHAMVRQAIYQRLGATRRARLHMRVGQALERMCGGEPGERTAELARQFLAGRPANAVKAARYARLAGERALAALAPDEALRWFGQALEALRDVSEERERVRCLVGLGDAQHQLGIFGARLTLLEAAREAHRLDEPAALIRAALATNRGMFARLGQTDAQLVATLEAALDACPTDGPQRARLLSRLAAELAFHPDLSRRRAIADEAVALARASGDAGALLDALTRPDTALMIPELSQLRWTRLREAQILAAQVDDPVTGFWAAYQFALLLFERADPDGVEEALGLAEAFARRVGQPYLRFFVGAGRGCQALLAGAVGEAERLVVGALQTGIDSGQPDAEAICSGQLFCVRWHQGRLGELIAPLNQMVAKHPDHRGMPATLALAELLGGEPANARQLFRDAADTCFAMPRTYPWLFTMGVWAEVAAELGDRHAASVLYGRLRPWHELFAVVGPTPAHCVAHYLGRLAALQGRLRDAEEHFAEALTVHRRINAPFCIAGTQLAWGRLLLPHNPDRARPLLASAAALAARHGYRYLLTPALAAGELPSPTSPVQAAGEHPMPT